MTFLDVILHPLVLLAIYLVLLVVVCPKLQVDDDELRRLRGGR